MEEVCPCPVSRSGAHQSRRAGAPQGGLPASSPREEHREGRPPGRGPVLLGAWRVVSAAPGCGGVVLWEQGSWFRSPSTHTQHHTHTQLARTASVLLFAVELALGTGSSQWPLPRSPPGVWGTMRVGRPQALTPRIPCRPPPPPAWHHPPSLSGAGKWLLGPLVGTALQAGRPVDSTAVRRHRQGHPGQGQPPPQPTCRCLWSLVSHWAVDSSPVSCHTRWLSANSGVLVVLARCFIDGKARTTRDVHTLCSGGPSRVFCSRQAVASP